MRYLARLRAACIVATASLLPFVILPAQPTSEPARALVYCPVGIDAVGCTNIIEALGPSFPAGVDRGYDGTAGTVDLKTVDLWRYEVFLVPSLADVAAAQPYALLRDAVVAERLNDALMGRIAMWSGTPDLGSAASPNREQKNALIVNLARWAAGNYAVVKGPGLVTFLDQSETAADRYDWVRGLTGINVAPDLKLASYSAVSALTPTATSILSNGDALLAYANMAAFGFQVPWGAAGVSLDAIGSTGTTVGGQVVLVTAPGGNTGGAIVKTDLDDYAPGTTVVMTGSGWQPGETVSLTLHEDPQVDADRVFTTQADASGNIEFSGFAPEQHDIDVRFILTAVGASSGFRAQTTFTDGVTFAGSTTADNGAGATSLMVPVPTGTAVGDLLLAQVTFAGGNLITPTPPAGWSSLPRNNSGSALGQVIYWKIATASEPASYSWGFSALSKATGGIVRYSAVDIGGNLNPIAASGSASGSQPAGFSTTLVAPSITVPTRSTMVVTFFSVRANAGLSIPAEMTERHQRANANAAAPPGPSIMASDIAQFETGVTGTSTSIASDRGAWVAHTVAIDWRQTATAAGIGSVALTRPADATPGDLLLANIVYRGSAAVTVSVPEGWFLVDKRTNTGTPLTQATYRRVVGTTEPASYTWTLSSAVRAVGGITAYSGIDTDAPIDAVATSPATDAAVDPDLSPTAPSITTTVPGTVIAALYGIDGSAAVVAPTGMTLRYDVSTNGNTRSAAADVSQNEPATIGPRVASTAIAARWVAQTVALRRRPVPAKLAFSTPPQSGVVNACLGPFTIEMRDEYDRVAIVAANLTVNVASNGDGVFHSESACTTSPVSSVTMASGASALSVWYKPTVLGSGAHEMTASAGGVIGASQTQTISPDPVVTPPAPSIIAPLVRTTATSLYAPPSPDPSGLAWAAHLGRLVLVDGEVDEVAIFGGNVFEAAPAGSLTRAWSTTAFTVEAVGAAYNPSDRHLFLADDDRKEIFEIDPGADGEYGTADDDVRSFDTRTFGSDDPEGLAFDAVNRILYVADGVNAQVYRVSPGANGIFDGVAPAGDDQVSSFDTQVHGLLDPEGIAFDSDLGHLYVVGRPNTRVFEFSAAGVLLRTIDISAAGAHKPAGLEYLPASATSGPRSLFIVDRGVDNDTDPNENDGRLYQLALPPVSGNTVPSVTVTSPADGSAHTRGNSITFTATATDAEDGDLASALAWSSSRDGALGSGASLSTSALSEGTHSITASVTDANGAQASATIVVTVNAVAIPTTVGSITASASVFGGTTDLSATVSPAVAGSVTFFVAGSTTPIEASYDAETGVATLNGYTHGLSASASGYSVRAVFTSGAVNYLGSESTSAAALEVAQLSQAISFDLSGVAARYGDAPFSLAAMATGGASGNSVTFAAETPATCDIGEASLLRIVAAGLCTITASQAGNTNYAAAAPVSRSFTIGARPLTITATGVDKVYDGTTAATVSLSDDRVAGDDLTITYAAAFNDANVGTAKPITISSVAVTGAAAGNYTVDGAPGASASITALTVTGEIVADDKIYDGTTAAVVRPQPLAGAIAGDAIELVAENAHFDAANAGQQSVRADLSLGGAAAGNYLLTASTAMTTARIAPRALTVSAVGSSRVYDGTVAATVTLSDDRLAGDLLTVEYSAASFASKTVGTGKPIAVNGITVAGPAAANYTFNTTATAVANITVRALVVSALGIDKVYDGTTTATVTLSDNRVAGDVFTTTYTTAAFSNPNAGTAKPVTVSGIALTGTDAVNYATGTTASTTANITPAPATITLGKLSQKWDGGTKLVSTTTSPGGLAVTVTYSQNGLTVAAPRNAGFYDVAAAISNPNYRGTATGTLVILNLIDLTPGNSKNPLSLSDPRTPELVVAVLGTATFNATTVAAASATFGDGVGADAPILRSTLTDVNSDGRVDMVLYFAKSAVVSAGNVTKQTKELVLNATLTSGAPIRGTDKVMVSP